MSPHQILTGAVVSVAAVVFIGPSPVGAALLGSLALVLLVRSATARLAWFVGGGLLVFQSSDAVGALKLAYLAGVVLVTVLSATRLQRSRAPWLIPFRWVQPAAVLLLVMLGASFFVAYGVNGASAWLRDALPYLLLAVAPLIALDAAHDVSEAIVLRASVLVGVLTAVGFTADWLARRGVSSLPIDRLVLGSGILASLGFAFAIALVATGPRRWLWACAAVSIPAILLTTGSRSLIVLGAAFLGLVGTKARHRLGPAKVAVALVVSVAALIWAVPRLVGLVSDDPAFLTSRVRAARLVIDGGGTADGSYSARSQSYSWALDAWHQHLWIGTGPGHLYQRGSFTLDTPVLTLAKLGIVGSVILLGFLIVLVMAAREGGRAFGWRPAHTGIRAFVCVVVASIPFGAVPEDKGFAFATALAVCGVAAAARESQATNDGMNRSACSVPGSEAKVGAPS